MQEWNEKNEKKFSCPIVTTVNIPSPPLPLPSKVPLSRYGPSLWGPGAEDGGKMDVAVIETLHVPPGLLAHINVIDTHQCALGIFCLRCQRLEFTPPDK